MIIQVDSSCTGHIDMTAIDYGGAPVNACCFSNENWPRCLRKPKQLMQSEAAYPGLERINVSHPLGTPQSSILKHLQQFAEEVMPAFTQRVPETVAGD
ncbi:MAG: hypothetical protein AB7N91_25360 [Candidatus Tectimicrobiota bacterium]